MTIHPLAWLGFEPVARPARPTLADLGFAAVTVANSQAAEPVAAADSRQSSVAAEPKAVAPKAVAPKSGVTPSVVKGSLVKGARVRLADGSVAQVLYVDPQMRIVRVRTDTGRNLTVRRKDLRQDHR